MGWPTRRCHDGLLSHSLLCILCLLNLLGLGGNAPRTLFPDGSVVIPTLCNKEIIVGIVYGILLLFMWPLAE